MRVVWSKVHGISQTSALRTAGPFVGQLQQPHPNSISITDVGLQELRRSSSQQASTSGQTSGSLRCRAWSSNNGIGEKSDRQAVQSPRKDGGKAKLYDVVAFSNLCVDIVVSVDAVPAGIDEQLLSQLTAKPPPVETWEVRCVSET